MTSNVQIAKRVRARLANSVGRRAGALHSRLTSEQDRAAATIDAFRALPAATTRDAVIDRFHELYYGAGFEHEGTWWKTTWLGITIWKCPLDVWLYQEIIFRLRPDLIIETGTAHGGSASYLGTICDLVDNGQIVSVDLSPQPDLPAHPRVRYITASSTDPTVVSELAELARAAGTVLVILDSDHSKSHVADELAAYAPLVTVGSYVIVEDTNVNGHPVWQEFGPGPMEATEEFLADHPEFVVDPEGEKFMLTFNPRGLLKRTL